MISKLNIMTIVKDHISTLEAKNGDKWKDIVVFYAFPLILGLLFLYFKIKLSDSSVETLITAGTLFAGLLLSLLVLVFDQRNKLSGKQDDASVKIRTALYELFSNISYAVLISITLIIASFVQQIVCQDHPSNTPITIKISIANAILAFLSSHLLLTVLMILKRINLAITADV